MNQEEFNALKNHLHSLEQKLSSIAASVFHLVEEFGHLQRAVGFYPQPVSIAQRMALGQEHLHAFDWPQYLQLFAQSGYMIEEDMARMAEASDDLKAYFIGSFLILRQGNSED